MIVIARSDWYRDENGAAVIDSEVGAAVWRRARDAREAKKHAKQEADEIDKAIRSIIGPGSSLVLADGRGVAVLTRAVRRTLSRDLLLKAGVDLDRFMVESEVRNLELAALDEVIGDADG